MNYNHDFDTDAVVGRNVDHFRTLVTSCQVHTSEENSEWGGHILRGTTIEVWWRRLLPFLSNALARLYASTYMSWWHYTDTHEPWGLCPSSLLFFLPNVHGKMLLRCLAVVTKKTKNKIATFLMMESSNLVNSYVLDCPNMGMACYSKPWPCLAFQDLRVKGQPMMSWGKKSNGRGFHTLCLRQWNLGCISLSKCSKL